MLSALTIEKDSRASVASSGSNRRDIQFEIATLVHNFLAFKIAIDIDIKTTKR
jgi:hypothetical protein